VLRTGSAGHFAHAATRPTRSAPFAPVTLPTGERRRPMRIAPVGSGMPPPTPLRSAPVTSVAPVPAPPGERRRPM
jgi:hypothetical protein